MHRGVVQGGTISASLFSLCIDAVCARLQARWQSQGRTGPLNVARVHQWLWAYADDLLLFASSVAEVKALLADVRAELSAVGLEVNLEKIQMFAAPWTVPPGTTVVLGGRPVTVAASIVYLGLPVGFEVSNVDFAGMLLAKAWRAFFRYKGVLCNRLTDPRRRLTLLDTYVTSAWSWAACHVRPTCAVVQQFQTAWLMMVTSILAFSHDREHLDWVQDFTARRRASRMFAVHVGVRDWADVLLARIFTWYGHLARMPLERSRPAAVALRYRCMQLWRRSQRGETAAVALRYRCMQLWRRSQRGETSTLTHPVRGSWPSVDRLLQELVESSVALDADWLTLASDREAWRALLPVWKERWMPQPGGTDLFGRVLHLPVPGLPWPSLSRVGRVFSQQPRSFGSAVRLLHGALACEAQENGEAQPRILAADAAFVTSLQALPDAPLPLAAAMLLAMAPDGYVLAPGTEATWRALTDPEPRPPQPRSPIPAELLAYEPKCQVQLAAGSVATALREAKRGGAAGLSGMRAEHLKMLLQDAEAMELLADAATLLARAHVPPEIQTALAMARL
eukprot:s9130_g2.t1